MIRPGDRLRALAARVCSAETMARLIDPVVADLQAEHRDAVRAGRTWKSRRVLLTGYVAFLKVVILCGWKGPMPSHRNWTADDRRALGRTLAFSVMSAVAITVLLDLQPWLALARLPRSVDERLLLYLVPPALNVAVPVGAMLGILFGLGGRVFSRRVMGWVLALTLTASAATFINLAWILPAANQAFRVIITGRVDLPPGAADLSLGELGRQVKLAQRGLATVWSYNPRGLAFAYHYRWAFSCSPSILALFAFAILSHRSIKRWALGIAAFCVFLGYSTLLYGSRALVLDGTVPAYAGAWLPNVVFVLVAAALAAFSARGRRLREPAAS